MAMGEEELYESEVLWPEPEATDDDDDAAPASAPGCSSSSVAPRAGGSRRGVVSQKPRHRSDGLSRPVDIPKPARSIWRRDDNGDDDDGGYGGTMVPPHVLLSRRRSEGAVAFALRSGPVRARELSHLRNSVLRMTGFIEG